MEKEMQKVVVLTPDGFDEAVKACIDVIMEDAKKHGAKGETGIIAAMIGMMFADTLRKHFFADGTTTTNNESEDM